MEGDTGTGLVLTDETLNRLAMGYDPYPALAQLNQAPPPGMGTGLRTGVPPAGDMGQGLQTTPYSSMVMGAQQKPAGTGNPSIDPKTFSMLASMMPTPKQMPLVTGGPGLPSVPHAPITPMATPAVTPRRTLSDIIGR
jgi:hypothetical protein